MYRFTDPARDRYAALLEEDRATAEGFRSALRDFVRQYAFLSQIVPYADAELERLYLFGRFLLNRLPRREDPGVDIGEVKLTHFRISKTGEHDVSLAAEGEQVLPGFVGEGGGPQYEPPKKSLTELIEELNNRHGLNLSEADRLFVEQAVVTAKEDEKLRAAAMVNTEENFAEVFNDKFDDIIIERQTANSHLMQRYFDDTAFGSRLRQLARRAAYDAIRREANVA